MGLRDLAASVYGRLLAEARSIQAYFNFKQERRIQRTGDKIRVGFMCQYIPGWGKMEPVYNRLKEDERFEVFLLCVPLHIMNQELENKEDTTNDTYEYYVSHGYEAINTLVGKNQWLDLRTLNLDFLFFTRPYNNYMPKQYSSHEVSKYTKICVLLYAFTQLEDTYSSTLNRDFFCNVYYYFAENTHAMQKNISHFKKRHRKGIQKSVCYGMAGMEDVLRGKDAQSRSWEFSKQDFRVMWTPRWTTDSKLGGSNFFVYREALLDYAKGHLDMDFLFRPHPMMFENFIRTGEMTAEEVKEYKKKIEQMPNVSLDVEKEYAATVWNSSVLVSDISSFMVEYFLTGKPILYCASNMECELAENAKELVKGCYVVCNKEEMFRVLEQLKKGEDPLRDTREKLMKPLFGENIERIPEQIVEELFRGSRLGE